eukprot:1643314-Rhodomonas_salina.4
MAAGQSKSAKTGQGARKWRINLVYPPRSTTHQVVPQSRALHLGRNPPDFAQGRGRRGVAPGTNLKEYYSQTSIRAEWYLGGSCYQSNQWQPGLSYNYYND